MLKTPLKIREELEEATPDNSGDNLLNDACEVS
jgi:hypothetical protein